MESKQKPEEIKGDPVRVKPADNPTLLALG